MMHELTVVWLEDDDVGLENQEKLIEVLRSEASNLGDGRCLCHGCIYAWVLAHFVDHPGGKWEVEAGEIAHLKEE